MVPKSQKKCSVCTDPEILDNEIFNCISCKVNVHRLCYGIESDFDENWKCSPCNEGKKDVTCKLCVKKKGSFKKTVCGGWAHVICGLFTDGCVFENPNSMEPINIAKVSKNKRNKTCVYCNQSCGFCCLCSNSKCNNRIHITCAQNMDGLKEETKKDGTLKFRAFCGDHKPKTTERRISSGSIRRKSFGTVEIAKKIEKNKKNGANLNAQWIMNASENAESGKSAAVGVFDESLERAVDSSVIVVPSKEDANRKSSVNGNFDKLSQKNRANSKEKTEAVQTEKNHGLSASKRQKVIENRPADLSFDLGGRYFCIKLFQINIYSNAISINSG